ncbi:hypothetical protein [Saccharomonospora sp. NB11]|jgi:hypothetical protein|uniref:hypothetical protein n=1 Tax=Saccharomonospora sp. NB11 TaxID=1642298 RepID=UPI0018D1D21F|nr:hypothetical protein [Saccharomonospora sp. NB11]
MRKMPSTRALFGYDIIGASSHDDDQLEPLRAAAHDLVDATLRDEGVDLEARANYAPTGDGALAAFEEADLPLLIDAIDVLHRKLRERNRWHKPELRLRISIHAAPVHLVERESFQRGPIDLARILDAAPLKSIATRLRDFRPDTVFGIVSDQAFRTAVRGRYTDRIYVEDFASITVENKEFTDRCWICAPGVDARRISEVLDPEIPTGQAEARSERTQAPNSGTQTIGLSNATFNGNNYAPMNFGFPQGNAHA